MGIEPTSQPWQGRVLAVVLHLHLLHNTKYIIDFQYFHAIYYMNTIIFNCFYFNIQLRYYWVNKIG